METWEETGKRLGAPGTPAGSRDPGPVRVLLAGAIVGALWAQGGIFRTVGAITLAAILLLPGPGGKSLLRVVTEGVEALLKG